MIDLSDFTQLAINMGAIQHPPMGDVKNDKVNASNFGLVAQNHEINIMMSDVEYAFEERAAILEYDGGYSREEAERLARLEIYGEIA